MTKEFIIENQDKTLKELFPEHFTKFTGWARTTTDLDKKWVMYFNEGAIQYGFNGFGEWCESKSKIYQFDSKIETEADFNKIESTLVAEATRRGYKQGLLIQDIYNGDLDKSNVKISSDFFDYETIKAGENQGQMALRDSNGSIIFHNGVWAEIVNTMTKEEAEEKFNIVIR